MIAVKSRSVAGYDELDKQLVRQIDAALKLLQGFCDPQPSRTAEEWVDHISHAAINEGCRLACYLGTSIEERLVAVSEAVRANMPPLQDLPTIGAYIACIAASLQTGWFSNDEAESMMVLAITAMGEFLPIAEKT